MKRSLLTNIAAACILMLLLMQGSAWSGGAPDCYGYGDFFGSVCWRCFFPITICGVPVVGGEDFPTNVECICHCPNITQIPGIMISYWAPVYVAEIVKRPFCSPFLGGAVLHDPDVASLKLRGTKNIPGPGGKDTVFYNAHFLEYPIGSIMKAMDNANACYNMSDLNYIYLTELDPMWMDDELSYIINPEATLFANALSQISCAADCVAASVGFSLPPLFWCAGCWGSIYPFTGHTGATTSPIQWSGLLATRMLAKLHREMLAHLTTGPTAKCFTHPNGVIFKGQYKMQMMYPFPEIEKCNPIGRSQMIIGDWRTIPTVGEDYVWLIWRKRDCCVHSHY